MRTFRAQVRSPRSSRQWRHAVGRPTANSFQRRVTQTYTAQQELLEDYAEEDFYAIMGVSPNADPQTIRRAYKGMMLSCHPDRTQDEDATNFCALLNEIYDTLMDADRRALYDDIAGFSMLSINPFLDTSYERDQVFVDEATCIGCRNCNNVCPQTFGMEEEWGRARAMAQGIDTDEKLQEAIDTCPVSCIYWVTAPQLSLLDAAMARMERTPVWSQGGQGKGANIDVFTEASLAWTKRQSLLAARRETQAAPQEQQQQQQQAGWNFWGQGAGFGAATGSTFYQQAEQARTKAGRGTTEGDPQQYSDKDARSIATLAARAARAARTWKRYQEAASAARRSGLSLSSVSSASMGSMDS